MEIRNWKNNDLVRVCKSDVCIEARGKNGEVLIFAFVFLLACVGIAALIKAK